MRLLVTGKQGQLVRSLDERSAGCDNVQLLLAGRPEVDLKIPGSLAGLIAEARPDVVINAAAYTAVDRAEDEPELAFRINADAAGEAALAARSVGAPIIQISTDYVFGGSSEQPYSEDSPINPLGVYGASKVAGEDMVRSANPDHLILRTSWVYSPFGRNFVKTMLGLAGEWDEVRVVGDQLGSPTSAFDIADGLLLIAWTWGSGNRVGYGDTFHFAGAGGCSWAEFAAEIFRLSGQLAGPTASVTPIATSDFPTRARRPANSRLDCSRFEAAFGFPMRDWRSSLAVVIERLLRPAPVGQEGQA